MRFSELDGRRIGIWGAGIETRSFVRHVAEKLPHARIAVVVLEEPADASELATDVAVVSAESAPHALEACEVLVRSPGVSIHRPELRHLRRRGLPVVTPTGLWLSERAGRNVIGVTGTKGKSTTATVLTQLLRAAGRNVHLAGNIGHPALDLLDEPETLAVVELSSYQIADLTTGPETAIVINLYAEHLDWHQSIETYQHEKLRILALPGVRNCVVNAMSPLIMAAPRAAGATCHTFGDAAGWHPVDRGVALGETQAISLERMPLLGRHNAMNLCAVLTALAALGIPLPRLPDALEELQPLPHRLQLVHESGGVSWVDDSISTTAESAIAAIDSFPDRDLILIGGGLDRGQDYRALARRLAERQATVIGLPTTGVRLVSEARAAGIPPDRAVMAEDMSQAVALACASVAPDSVVLLSPAAPSYNSYPNYVARGEHFLQLARAATERSRDDSD